MIFLTCLLGLQAGIPIQGFKQGKGVPAYMLQSSPVPAAVGTFLLCALCLWASPVLPWSP